MAQTHRIRRTGVEAGTAEGCPVRPSPEQETVRALQGSPCSARKQVAPGKRKFGVRLRRVPNRQSSGYDPLCP